MTNMTAIAAASILMFAIVPVWLAAGLTDYFCHRAAHIEATSGPRESMLHIVQLGLVGAPVMLTLFLDVNAGLFAIWMICLVLHHGVAFVDVRFANLTRLVSPFEQMVHSVLELAPLMAFVLLAVLFWPQLIAVFGLGHEPARWALAPKPQMLPPVYIVSVLLAALVFNAAPYLEELIRTLRAKRLDGGM